MNKNVKAPLSFVRMATTTSTNDSGLLPYLRTGFSLAYPQYYLTWVSVGSGRALELGREGAVDVCFTHAPELENVFIADDFAENPAYVMYNEFIGLGPSASSVVPPGSLTALFAHIHANHLPFLSRGDISGTHLRELEIWADLHIVPTTNPNYRVSGTGMSATIHEAALYNMYTLSDNATWFKDKTDDAFVNYRLHQVTTPQVPPEGFAMNQYTILPINPDADFIMPPIEPFNSAGAQAFRNWLLTGAAQTIINGYLIGGQQVFIWNAAPRP